MPQKQASITLLLDPWQKVKKTSWGFNLSSCVRYRRWGLGFGLKWKLIQCEMGLEANPLDLSKRKTYHTQRKIWCHQDLGERNLTCCSLKWLLTALKFIVPLIIFVPWRGINNLNKGVRITAAALINNATAWLDTGWMEAPQATNPKWAPKETLQNGLREVKRPVNNINNILSEEKGGLWCFNLSLFLLLWFFVVFAEIRGRFLFPCSLKQKRAVSCCWILLLNPVLILIWSDSPKSSRHLGGQRQDFSSWHWHNNQPMQPTAVWLETKVAYAQLEENHLKCHVTSDNLIYSCTQSSKTFNSHSFFWIPTLTITISV